MATLNELTQLHQFLSKSLVSHTRFISSPNSCPSTLSKHALSLQIPHLDLSLKPQWPQDMDWTGYGSFDEGENFQMSDREESSPEINDNVIPFQHASKSNKANQEHGADTIADEDQEDSNSDSSESALGDEEEENKDDDLDALSISYRKRKRSSSCSNDPFFSSAFVLVPKGEELKDEDDAISIDRYDALYGVDDGACSVVSSSSTFSSSEEFMPATSWERNGMPSKRAKKRAFSTPWQTDADVVPELDYEFMSEDEDVISGAEDPAYRTLSNGEFIGAGSGCPRFNHVVKHCSNSFTGSCTVRILTVWRRIAPTVRRGGGNRAVERGQQSSKGREARVMDVERNTKREDDEDNGDGWAWNHCKRCKRVERAGTWCFCCVQKTVGSNITQGEEIEDGRIVFVSEDCGTELDGEDECIEISEDDTDSCSLAREYEGDAADDMPPCDEEWEYDPEEKQIEEEEDDNEEKSKH